MATVLYDDEPSFRTPRLQAIEQCRQAFIGASRCVRGAEQRLRAAIDDYAALEALGKEVERRLRESSFHELPGMVDGRERLHGLHYLEQGPWRGVFLVSADGTQVVGLLFSRQPHALDVRLDEIANAYRRRPGRADDDASTR
ncbi:MAG: hypothetical protein WD928_13885 [Gammaproteobacteria bacterium]